MSKEWYAAKELIGISIFPKSPQTVNQKAKIEGWRKQKRIGVQGKAFEYHISSFPQEVITELLAREEETYPTSSPSSPEYAWARIYLQMSIEEREKVIQFIVREGIDNFLKKFT